jgi:hypothetical protein
VQVCAVAKRTTDIDKRTRTWVRGHTRGEYKYKYKYKIYL